MATTTSPTSPPREEAFQLREEDLEVGRPFVHPETRLEYEDFHALLCGHQPLAHWRNKYIQRVLRGDEDHTRVRDPETCLVDPQEFRRNRIERITRYYDRDGHPFAAARTDEHDLAHAPA